MFTATQHAELHDAGNFLAEAHAAGALNTAAHLFHGNQRTGLFVENNAFFFFVARRCFTVTDGQILQLTFTTLIADRAIQRMIDQQKLHDFFLGLDRLVALGAHDHAGRDRRGAGRQRLGRLFHLDQTHAAIGRNRQFFVIAKMRDVRAQFIGRVHHHAARWHFDFFAVYFYFNHSVLWPVFKCKRVPSNAYARCDIQTLHGNS